MYNFDLGQKQDSHSMVPILKERLHEIDEKFLKKLTKVELSTFKKSLKV